VVTSNTPGLPARFTARPDVPNDAPCDRPAAGPAELVLPSLPRIALGKYEHLPSVGTRIAAIDPAVRVEPRGDGSQGLAGGEPDSKINDGFGQQDLTVDSLIEAGSDRTTI
jgi:hypothetical protein